MMTVKVGVLIVVSFGFSLCKLLHGDPFIMGVLPSLHRECQLSLESAVSAPRESAIPAPMA